MLLKMKRWQWNTHEASVAQRGGKNRNIDVCFALSCPQAPGLLVSAVVLTWKTKKKIEMRDSEERDKENKTRVLGSQSKLASRKPCLYSQSRFPNRTFLVPFWRNIKIFRSRHGAWVIWVNLTKVTAIIPSPSLPYILSSPSPFPKGKKTPDHWLYQSTEQWLGQTLLICHRSVQKKKKRLGGSVIRETKLSLKQNTQEFIRVVGQIQ